MPRFFFPWPRESSRRSGCPCIFFAFFTVKSSDNNGDDLAVSLFVTFVPFVAKFLLLLGCGFGARLLWLNRFR